MKIIGPVLLIAGLVGLGLGAIEYSREKTLVDAGPLRLTTTETERFTIPPVAAGVVAALGGALTAFALKRR